jgi:hypothetical protein
MQKKEEKDEDLLKELCGDDAKLYDVLGSILYFDPMAAIPKKDLKILIKETEKSVKNGNYEEASQKYRQVMDKAIFDATQNPMEKSKYVKVIQDLASKAVHATEKTKEKVEKKGLTKYASSFRRRIDNYKFMSERTEDVLNVASHFYNERLEELGAKERQEARRDSRRDTEREERRIEERVTIRREARREKRKKMGREERKEAEREETRIEEREEKEAKERREARREAEREETRIEEREEERRKERREARRKALR